MTAKTGDVEDDELDTMDRTALLEMVTKDIVFRRGHARRWESEKSGNVMVGNITFLMIFAVFDPPPLTLRINCRF